MGWLGDGSHRGQVRQAWTAVGLLPQYPQVCRRKYLELPKVSGKWKPSYDQITGDKTASLIICNNAALYYCMISHCLCNYFCPRKPFYPHYTNGHQFYTFKILKVQIILNIIHYTSSHTNADTCWHYTQYTTTVSTELFWTIHTWRWSWRLPPATYRQSHTSMQCTQLRSY